MQWFWMMAKFWVFPEKFQVEAKFVVADHVRQLYRYYLADPSCEWLNQMECDRTLKDIKKKKFWSATMEPGE